MSAKIERLLDDLQQQMQHEGLWQTIAPAPEKLMSTIPFSMDTLTFTEWLQWIYIARLRALLEAGAPMPSGAEVQPYAVESLAVDGVNSVAIITLIGKLDVAMKP